MEDDFPGVGCENTFRVAVLSNTNPQHLIITGVGSSFLLSTSLHPDHAGFRMLQTNAHVVVKAMQLSGLLIVCDARGRFSGVNRIHFNKDLDLAFLITTELWAERNGLQFTEDINLRTGTQVKPICCETVFATMPKTTAESFVGTHLGFSCSISGGSPTAGSWAYFWFSGK